MHEHLMMMPMKKKVIIGIIIYLFLGLGIYSQIKELL